MVQRKRKPQRGDRELSKLFSNKLDILSPPRGFCYCRNLTGGFTPVCSLSHLRCFNPNSSQQETPFKRGCLTLHGESAYTPRRIGLHSTENRLTLHGASADATASIFRSTSEATSEAYGKRGISILRILLRFHIFFIIFLQGLINFVNFACGNPMQTNIQTINPA